MSDLFDRVLRAAQDEGCTLYELPMWVIYDRPTDYPKGMIARLWISLPAPAPTDKAIAGETIEDLRIAFTRAGFCYMPRSAQDDPVILETWV